MKKRISRRQFISTSAATTAVLGAAAARGRQQAQALAGRFDAESRRRRLGALARRQAAAVAQGVTWGTPWPRGKQREAEELRAARRGPEAPAAAELAARLLARRFAQVDRACAAAGRRTGNGPFEVVAQPGAAKLAGQREREGNATARSKSTPASSCAACRAAARTSSTSITRGGREALRDGKLVLLRQDRAASSGDAQVRQENFESAHRESDRRAARPGARGRQARRQTFATARAHWLPFTLRLYFYAGSDALRVLHTIVFDGDESQDFIRGIGLRFSAPLTDALHDRHVRFAGEQDGVFGEAVRGLTGLRRDPGAAARKAQIDGVAAARHRARRQRTCCSTFRPSATGRCCSRTPTLSPSASAPPTATPGSTRRRAVAPAASGTSAARRAASPSAFAISGRAIRRSSTSAHAHENRGHGHDVGVGAGRAADGPALLSRRPGPGHVREAVSRAVSRSPTKTTSPASARRWASRAPAS